MTVDREKLRQLMREVAAERGEFTLFGLFLRAEAPDKWDLVVAAPWLEEGKLKALGEFVEKLSAAIGEQQLLSLSRVITVKHDDPSLEAILRAVEDDDSDVELSDCDFFGLRIDHAYIFRAKRPKLQDRTT